MPVQELNCVATGMDVHCEIPQPPAALECVGTGLDVVCELPEQAACVAPAASWTAEPLSQVSVVVCGVCVIKGWSK